ncbi:Protein of unknown function [Pyronema omphalodes CBS 100304]|uniref:Uncharacterized protein n=1 Tax=Pyronema omphalodes (strain CBS 100304) TaxID=1076935 RepID=U4LHC4_PYROM|nr:Protein of unknown function [Pyronema omphalodes CBS 100304]
MADSSEHLYKLITHVLLFVSNVLRV